MNTTWIQTTFVIAGCVLAGCADDKAKDRDFHTSGSREADQRAEQRIAQVQQIRGEGEGSNKPDTVKLSLYDRLGGQKGVQVVVNDFVDRAIADPRVNWERKGISKGILGIGGSAEWKPTPEAKEVLKKHIVQFITVATGGQAVYDGKDMKAAHKRLNITNVEFDASIGDMKASLDAFNIPIAEQKELLAILESTRLQVVEER